MSEQKKWYQNSDMIIALSALLVSLIATFVGVYSAYIDRSYAKATLWPNVQIYRNFSDNNYGFVVINNGTGPAVLNQIKVSNNGTYYNTWAGVMKEIGGEDAFRRYSQSSIDGRVLPAGESVNPFVARLPKLVAALKEKDTIKIEICYCSVFKDCWVVDRNNKPVEVDKCSFDPKKLFKH